jgi:AcrR family transcriptional regulator
VTASPRERLPTVRGRQTQAAIDAAARIVIARKGFLATTVYDIASEAGKSAASFYNYYDSKESMVREWVTQLAMVNEDFAAYWTDLTSLPISLISTMVEQAQQNGHCDDSDPKLTTLALISMLNGFCYYQFSGDGRADAVDDEACITTLANVFYRTIYHKETGRT